MSEFKGSDLLMKCLAELGVKHIFGMGGHGNLAICDGLYKAKDTYGIQGIIIHDESVGASAAGGYFKATGRPGVLLVTNGPGMMQAIPGVVEQAMSNSPVIVICGDIPTYQPVTALRRSWISARIWIRLLCTAALPSGYIGWCMPSRSP